MSEVVSGIQIGIQGSGQLVGELPPPALFAEVARRSEALGYDSIWAGDHISFENPILDVTVALATFVEVTSRITVGAAIVLLPLRPPAIVAKEFASLDYLSGGRSGSRTMAAPTVIRLVTATNVASATVTSRIGFSNEMWSPAQIES